MPPAESTSLINTLASNPVLLVVGALVLGLIAFGGGFGALLLLRKNLAGEIKRELADQSDPQQVQVQNPLTVKPHVEFASMDSHRELAKQVAELRSEVSTGFARLDQKRSSSIAGLHDDLRDAVADLRTEMKSDNTGLNTRITEVLAAVSELKGRISGLIQK